MARLCWELVAPWGSCSPPSQPAKANQGLQHKTSLEESPPCLGQAMLRPSLVPW